MLISCLVFAGLRVNTCETGDSAYESCTEISIISQLSENNGENSTIRGVKFTIRCMENNFVDGFKFKLNMDNPQPGSSTNQNVYSTEECDDSMMGNNRKKRRQMNIYDSDSSESNSSDNVETDIEDIEETPEEINSDSTNSYMSENDDLNEFIEDSGSDEEWMCDGSFKRFVYAGNPGLKCSPDRPDPYNFFKLLLDSDLFTNIVIETNIYGNSIKGDQWTKLTVDEFKIFLGLLLHMGTIKCPQIQNYWSTKRLFSFNCFLQYMSRSRFQEILHCLRFCSNSTNSNHLNKVQPIIDYFNNKMKHVYYPHKEFSIDEMMVPWRGRLVLRQYNAGKKSKHGIKLYILTESSGMTFRIMVYERSRDGTSGQERTTKMVLHLLEDFLQKGHSVYMDNSFSSYELSKQLINVKTYCTGTLHKSRQGNSVNVVNAKLAEGEVISRHKNNVMMGKFRDKRDILFISSEFEADLIKLENKRRGNHEKPLVLQKYKEFTNGIDKKYQLLSYYTSLRRKFKWYVQLWIYIVETLLLNSYFLYSKYSPPAKRINFVDFRVNIIDALLFENGEENIPSTLAPHEHLPEILPRDENNRVKRKRCRQCFAKGLRKNTNYFCSGCTHNPGLCLGECFKEYHKDLS